MRTHLCTLAVAAMLALPWPAVASHVTVLLETSPSAMSPGDTFTVTVRIPAAGSQFNAFQLSLGFNPDQVDFLEQDPLASHPGAVVTAACSNLFHVLQPAPDSLKASVSLLCAQTFLTGPGPIYRFRFTARSQLGVAYLSLKPSSGFNRAGVRIDTLTTRPVTVAIGDVSGVADPAREGLPLLAIASLAPNPARAGVAASLRVRSTQATIGLVRLFDGLGRLVWSKESLPLHQGDNQISLPLPSVKAGVYFVQLSTSSGQSVTRKINISRQN